MARYTWAIQVGITAKRAGLTGPKVDASSV